MNEQPVISPPAEGVRTPWSDLPERVRTHVEARLGSRVVSATTQPSGFSPGCAARLRTAADERVFVKAVGSEPNAASVAAHRREVDIVTGLPEGVAAPRLFWSHDEGEGGWVVLAFEEIDGRHPHQPWRDDELDRVLNGLAALAGRLTPSPLASGRVPLARDEFAEHVGGWRELQAKRPDGMDDWSVRHVSALAELEARAPDAVEGDSLLHSDVRADNLLLTDERVYLVDWANAIVGAPWIDLLFFAPSVTMQGGPDPEALLARSDLCRGIDPDALTVTIAAIAGYFTHRALQPPPPGLPTLRPFQAAQGRVAREWLARRMGWE